jgi:hypothetical protein
MEGRYLKRGGEDSLHGSPNSSLFRQVEVPANGAKSWNGVVPGLLPIRQFPQSD